MKCRRTVQRLENGWNGLNPPRPKWANMSKTLKFWECESRSFHPLWQACDFLSSRVHLRISPSSNQQVMHCRPIGSGSPFGKWGGWVWCLAAKRTGVGCGQLLVLSTGRAAAASWTGGEEAFRPFGFSVGNASQALYIYNIFIIYIYIIFIMYIYNIYI